MNSNPAKCSDEIARILSEIIRSTVLRIRMAGWNKQPEICASEADHIHNLPGLIFNYSQDCLKYYLEVEVPCYVNRCNDRYTSEQKKLWQQLQDELQKQIDQR